MKLNHYLKDYGAQDQEKINILTAGMTYSAKLELVKRIKVTELPDEGWKIKNLSRLIEPLSDKKDTSDSQF